MPEPLHFPEDTQAPQSPGDQGVGDSVEGRTTVMAFAG